MLSCTDRAMHALLMRNFAVGSSDSNPRELPGAARHAYGSARTGHMVLWKMLKRGSSRPLLNRHRRGTQRWWLSPSRVQLEPAPPPGSRFQVPCDPGREGRDERWLRFAEQHVPSDAAASEPSLRASDTRFGAGVLIRSTTFFSVAQQGGREHRKLSSRTERLCTLKK